MPTRLNGGDGETFLHNFGVLDEHGDVLDLAVCGERVADCIAAVWHGEAESDALNRLVISAGLTWHQVAVLRAYRKYRQRVGAQLPIEYQNDTFARHPDRLGAAGALLRGALRPDPADRGRRGGRAAPGDHRAPCDAITSLDDDRILRNHLGTVDATVRTNAFLNRPHLSFKFASAAVPLMPKPYPLYEIFVYSPAMEGIHLRGGRVARGGIRWSDRPEDYRTEILGLMKAQMVKNAVIVPVGSKGGFVLKHPPADRQELREEVVRQYTTLMSGMLDITDNLVDGEVVQPSGVRILRRRRPVPGGRRRQGHGVALRHGERHRRGVRLLARRRVRLRRLGRATTTRSSPSRRAARGSRSSATSANWASTSRPSRSRWSASATCRATCSATACCCPTRSGSWAPSTTATCSSTPTRIRPSASSSGGACYDLPGSSWDDYDRTKISAGGGVFGLDAKSVHARPRDRAPRWVSTTPSRRCRPAELMTAILRAPVDLLWNGGIGTFVKASDESHAEVGDRTNDGIRIDGSELRVPRRRRGRQPRLHAARPHRVRGQRADASTPTPSTTPPASTAPTTRSTSRSCSASPRPPAT